MDPDACLKEIRDILETEGATEEAKDRALDLMHWLDGKGFMPKITRRDLTALLGCVALARPNQKVGKPNYTD
jgi:hypothetical protein